MDAAACRPGGARLTRAFSPAAAAQVVVNYASGAARAEEVVAEVKKAGGDAVAIGGNIAKARAACAGRAR